MDKDKWVIASKLETWGDLGHGGIQISVLLPREVTEKEVEALSQIASQTLDSLMEETRRLDPERQEERKQERAMIVGLFAGPIFVREIPNGYCSQWCCKDKPWFEVTTSIGPITIGWRKRVISIDWSDSIVTQTAEDLFPYEETTKAGRSIHAWGYNKAREYVSALVAQWNQV